MDKVAFVFSGQGDQFPGMGKDTYTKYPVAAKVFDLCDSIRPGTARQCFEGAAEELSITSNTQPCLFAVELAAARTLMEKGIAPAAVAGFSLGEVVAATISGIFDDETGFRAVCMRGELMQREAEKHDTAMAAVVKLTNEQVVELCQRYEHVYPVNFNCPGQVTVAALASELAAFSADVKAAGGRALPLKVRGAFHSPFMAPASEAFAEYLSGIEMRENLIPLYSNITAEPYKLNSSDILARQISSPVKWEQLISNMIRDGISTFVEIGPGKTLTNMIKRIDANVRAITYAEYLEEIENA